MALYTTAHKNTGRLGEAMRVKPLRTKGALSHYLAD